MKYSPDAYLLHESNRFITFNIRIKVVMKDAVDSCVLTDAAEKAFKRFPYYSKQIHIDEEGGLDLIPNPRTVAVKAVSKKKTYLFSKEVNYQPCSIEYEGNCIYFNMYHGMCGGCGTFLWIKTTIYEYICARYGVKPNPGSTLMIDSVVLPDEYAYLSLHYTCTLPFGDKWPDEICGKKFEIQIRTILQHAWAAIHHDIGYKSDFGVPRDIKRQFARLAGLLELADDEFVRARDNMVGYTEDIRQKIITDEADDITINMISLNEYVRNNQKMKELICEIADIAGAEISEIDPESYIPQLAFLGITKLGDIELMIRENRELAIKLAKKALSAADLDIVSSSVALRFLCRAELLNKNYDFDKVAEFLKISLGTKEKAERQAKYLLNQKEEC